jgi:hypothetical protein
MILILLRSRAPEPVLGVTKKKTTMEEKDYAGMGQSC